MQSIITADKMSELHALIPILMQTKALASCKDKKDEDTFTNEELMSVLI